MPSSDEGVDDVFFNSSDCLSFEESVVAEEELDFGKLDYHIWMNEPCSVKERRNRFFFKMGLVEFSPKNEISLNDSSNMLGSDRISEPSSSMNMVDKNLVCQERGMEGDANCMVDEIEQERMSRCNRALEGESSRCAESFNISQNHLEDCNNLKVSKVKKLWKRIVSMKKRNVETCLSQERKLNSTKPNISRIKVKQNRKKFLEMTALYMSQEIQAHKGYIWTMKFSPDGQYLASGGEDGVVRIWRIRSVATSLKSYTDGDFRSDNKEGKIKFGKKKSSHVPIVIPGKVFQIEDSPLHEFRGHLADVLDIAWSNSNYLLSSSMDKTVRMWQVGCSQCLNVFRHHNYVTCIQFNPIDENYFISGSIDGKVRIWGVYEERVVDWAEVRDVISALCYHPDGKGFIVGSVTGTCRSYGASGNGLQLKGEVHLHDRKKSFGKRITGIQFSRDESKKIMITSSDSKLRILDGVDVIHKFKGLPKSGSQMSASFTSMGKHIISVGDDCRVYVWNYDELCFPSSKQKKSVLSCEHFLSEGVTVAAQWSGVGIEQQNLSDSSLQDCSQRQDNPETASWIRDSERFSLVSWFSNDGPCRGSATWPAEKLPLWDVTVNGDKDDQYDQQQQPRRCLNTLRAISETWGLVIVTAGSDGVIKTFHNYGLPIRV